MIQNFDYYKRNLGNNINTVTHGEIKLTGLIETKGVANQNNWLATLSNEEFQSKEFIDTIEIK